MSLSLTYVNNHYCINVKHPFFFLEGKGGQGLQQRVSITGAGTGQVHSITPATFCSFPKPAVHIQGVLNVISLGNQYRAPSHNRVEEREVCTSDLCSEQMGG